MQNNLTVLFVLFFGSLFGQNLSFYAKPSVMSATAENITIHWQVNENNAQGVAKWGLSPNQLDHEQAIASGENQITIPNLEPATVYYTQVTLNKNGNEINSAIEPFITSSLSSGEIKVFFNFSIDDSYSNGSAPVTTTASALEEQMIQYILSATKTIDICMYNINRKGYVNALKQASANGVRVRYIAEGSQSNFSLNTTLNFNLHYAETNGIMHNKWLIIDKEHTDKALVVMGSYNFTNSNLYEGYNNMISFQDQALAEVYTMEFEEMWGSNGDEPDEAKSKFGSSKTDNTPHIIYINGIKVESYFSPSDHTTKHIVDALKTTDKSLKFGLLVFTNDDMEEVIFNLDAPVQGLIESQYNGTPTIPFQNAGIPVYDFEEEGHFLHHKYALIDADSDSDPTIVTGSHNWSYSAEFKNDENTVIIHDADIVNIFRQEFEARWHTIVAIDDIDDEINISIQPNPASNYFLIQNNRSDQQTVSLVDCYGHKWEQWTLSPNSQQTVDSHLFPQGVYHLVLESKSGRVASKALVILPH